MKKIKLLTISSLAALLAVNVAASAASFDDNSLIRGRDGKIFVVRQGQKVKVNSLDELRRNFRGREIVNVDDNTLAQIRTSNSGRGSIRKGDLIRGRDQRIFEVEHGELRQIRDLVELRREHAGQAIHNVNDDTLREFELRGRDNEPGEDIRGNVDENEVRGRDNRGRDNRGRDNRGRDNEPDEDIRGNVDENEVRGRDNHAGEDNPARVGDDNLPRHSGVDNAPGGRGEIGGGRNSKK
ncbi:MAG: hypothetical protein HYV53_01735 [Parcubacteria group bacterium]|nr:hypothetical protein [Parcubacteria group bacterium]